uniref:Isopropylmalate dehydrogenase-like domain-containing protein n=1 Tax=Glossina palpalis gambiensis TaxID=67801 RepID=A0A1B0BS15_9MUSC
MLKFAKKVAHVARLSRCSSRCAIKRFAHSKVESLDKAFLKDDMPTYVAHLPPVSQYGGQTVITLLYADTGIGQRACKHLKSLIEISKLPITFENVPISRSSATVAGEDYYSLLRNRTAVYLDLELDTESLQKRYQLNRQLDLFACIAKFKSHPGYNCKRTNVNIWSYSQNNVGDYAKLEYEPVKGVVETLRITTVEKLSQFLRFAFGEALKNGRRKITIGHKADMLPKSDGLFLELAQRIHQEEYECLELNDMKINTMARNIVMNPEKFDVICSQSGYGRIINAAISAVCGGASLFSCVDLGERFAVFKPLEMKLALSDCREISPYGVVRLCIELLCYLGKEDCAKLIALELSDVMCRGIKTEEFGGKDRPDFVICSIVNNLQCHFA